MTKFTVGEKMVCQACDGKSHEQGKGCRGCGGYGYIAQVVKCPTCERSGWFRPGAFTSYEGKLYCSIDAMEMVCHLNANPNCTRCEEKK